MQYPNDIRPVDCPRCGMPYLAYAPTLTKGLDKGSNSIVIPVKCKNAQCGITFYEHYRFDKWTPV